MVLTGGRATFSIVLFLNWNSKRELCVSGEKEMETEKQGCEQGPGDLF